MSAAAFSSLEELEFAYAPEDHKTISAMVYEEVGILLPEGKAQMVYGRIAPRVRACRLDSVAAYVDLIQRDAAERLNAIDALTTNHTSFFRENHHFEHFTAEVWPALAKRLETGGRVRLWSAACSSGEEPYTWLMAALGRDRRTGERLLGRDLRLLATDVSPSILAKARTGRYPADGIRQVPAPLAAAWLRRTEAGMEIDPAIRRAISFLPLNLLGEWPIKGQFDAIFCRNVMIYFDEPTKARLQARLADRLAPGGTLYIGHSERLSANVAPRFQLVGRTIFHKVAA